MALLRTKQYIIIFNQMSTPFFAIIRNGLVIITSDFNPLSTDLDQKMNKGLAGLSQIINVKTRGDAILEWCLTNVKKFSLNRYNFLNLGQAIIIPSLFRHVFPGCKILITVPFSKGILGRATYRDLANGLPLTIGPVSCKPKTVS